MPQEIVFRFGIPKRPDGISHDNGFGTARRTPTGEEIIQFDAIKQLLNIYSNSVVKKIVNGIELLPISNIPKVQRFLSLPDAFGALTHFIEATGRDRNVDYDKFLSEDPAGRLLKLNIRYLARQNAERIFQTLYQPNLRVGGAVTFSMTGSRIAMNEDEDGDYLYPATENWQKTLGAHFVWASATVTVTHHPAASTGPVFNMVVTLHAEDRYNFNPGQKDIKSETPDEMFGKFEESGLAKSYMHYGESIFPENWIGRTINKTQVQYDLPGKW